MKDLKITQGEFMSVKPEGSNGYYEVTNIQDGQSVATCFGEDAESNSEVYADAHNTYQSTGITASELEADKNKWENAYVETCKRAGKLSTSLLDMKAERNELEKQRNELLEALKHFTDKVESGRARSTETYNYYKGILGRYAAIQSVEQSNNQSKNQ